MLLVARGADDWPLAEAMPRRARRRAARPTPLALDVTDARRRRAHPRRLRAALRQARRARQQRRHRALARPRRRPRGGLVRGLGAQRDGAAARDAGRGRRRWPSAAGDGSSTSPRPPAKRPSAQMPEYSVAKAAELSLSRLFADRYAGDGVLVNAICPGPTELGAVDGRGRPARPVARAGRDRDPRGGAARPPARSARSAGSPRSRRSPPRSSSSARSAPPTSPAPPGRSTAAPSR